MLGRRISDRIGVEDSGVHDGLALLDLETELERAKTTRRVELMVTPGDHLFSELAGRVTSGYEIHHGRTTAGAGVTPWMAGPGGALGHAAGNIWGCYVHGVFGDDGIRHQWLRTLDAEPNDRSWEGRVDTELDHVADLVEASLDMDRVLELLQ